MSQAKKKGYSVTISGKLSCLPSKSKYNKTFAAWEPVEANNYFHTLAERYQCYNQSKPTEVTQQAEGQNYIITLTTQLEHEEEKH